LTFHKKLSLFDILNVMFFLILGVVMLFPFLNVIALSLEPEHIAADTNRIHLIPQQATLDAYKLIWEIGQVQRAFWNSAYTTLVGTLLAVLLTGMMAYGLAQRHVPGMRLLLYMVMFTMVIKTGIIPTYMIIKSLGLINHLWAVIVIHLLSAFNLFLMKVFFENLPRELPESAKIDGCSEVGIFFRLIIPVSAPIFATCALFYAVGLWNDYFNIVMFITSDQKKTLQVLLREILIQSVDAEGGLSLGKNLKMATTIYAIVPILLVYPFLQKHFTKGILLGAVKG